MIRLYLIVGLVMAALLGGGGLWIRALRAENKLLENAYAIAANVAIDNHDALEAQLVEARRVDGILLARDRQRRTAEKRTETLNALLDNLKRTDPAVQAWHDIAVPDSVSFLLNHPEGPGQDRDPQTIPAPDPHPADRPPGH